MGFAWLFGRTLCGQKPLSGQTWSLLGQVAIELIDAQQAQIVGVAQNVANLASCFFGGFGELKEVRTEQNPPSRPFKHLFHCPPREQDQAAFSEHSKCFLNDFDAKADNLHPTSYKVGASVMLLGGAWAAAGVMWGGISPDEGMIITAITGVVASLAVAGAQVELTRKAQTNFLSDAKVPICGKQMAG